jgi:hypothetical protein
MSTMTFYNIKYALGNENVLLGRAQHEAVVAI